MRSTCRRTLAALVGLALLAAVAVVPSGHAAGGDEAKRARTPREKLAERSFPNVVLTTHEGKKVRFYDDLVKDKIVLINFMYVRCEGICPGTTAKLVRVQKLLGPRVGKDIFIYSITLKPEEDTPAALNRYAKAYKAGPGWQFLTGDPKDVELLRRKLGFIDRDPARDAVKSNHTGMLRWGNEPLTLWAGCPSSLAPDKIVKEIGLVDWPKAVAAEGGDR
ncbi:MAG TPA: SCO family protein [Pyrinomonadaceae bacterium]